MTADRVPDLDELERSAREGREFGDERYPFVVTFEEAIALIQRVRQLERVSAETRQMLRLECGEVDANDWPDELHPADVIEKHLVPAWQARLAQLERVREAARGVIRGWDHSDLWHWPSWMQHLDEALAAVDDDR